MDIISRKNGIEVVNFGEINLSLTLDCGQAFRWESLGEGTFRGIAYGEEVYVRKTENGILFSGTTQDKVKEIWTDYFDLDTDHGEIIIRLSKDPFIKDAYEKYGTIRILRQEPWETLCSFIISSCNNIPRIKGIIKNMSQAFGEKKGESYSFPSAKVLAAKTPDDLAFLKAGYRVPYILDAASRVATEEISFENIRNMSQADAQNELMKIRGVGKKVADCTLLFSLGFTDVYPIDRHIKRATEEYYPNGIPGFFHPHSGLAQQYIFSHMIEK